MDEKDFYSTTHDGLKLHGRVYAAPSLPAHAPSVICLHGLTRNERDFREFARWLSLEEFGGKRFRTYCLSFRGRGQSDRDSEYLNYQPGVYAQDVLGMMDHFDIAEATLVGTSLGGIVSMLLCSISPDRFSAAVLNDIGPELAPEGLARIAGYVGKTGPVTSWDQAAERIKDINGVAFPEAPADFWQRFARNTFREEDGELVLDYDPKIAQALAEAGPAPDLWPPFETIACPLLSVRGELSDLFTEEIQAKMQAKQPHVEMAVVPNVGHAPTLEEPAAQASIKSFLSTL